MNPTNSKHNRPYNPLWPVAYFITFRTYGTWLHGDEGGSADRTSTNIYGTPVIATNQHRQRWEQNQMKHAAVIFNSAQQQIVQNTITEVAAYNKWRLHALGVEADHIHVVITAFKQPEAIMNSFKSWCTRRMRERKQISADIQPWSRHGSTRWLWTEDDLDACAYVTRGGTTQKEVALPDGRATE